MPKYTLTINQKKQIVDVDAGTPLLWVLRDTLGLTGTKYGCGEGICGSCVVHINGKAERSCILNVEDATGSSVTTIEGLAAKPGWISEPAFLPAKQVSGSDFLLE